MSVRPLLLTDMSPCLDCRVVKPGSLRSLFIKWRLKGVWKLFTVCANERIKGAWRGENSWWFRICFPVSRNTPKCVCGGRGLENQLAFSFNDLWLMHFTQYLHFFFFRTCIINITICHCGHYLVYTGNSGHPAKYWLAALIGTAGLS